MSLVKLHFLEMIFCLLIFCFVKEASEDVQKEFESEAKKHLDKRKDCL